MKKGLPKVHVVTALLNIRRQVYEAISSDGQLYEINDYLERFLVDKQLISHNISNTASGDTILVSVSYYELEETE